MTLTAPDDDVALLREAVTLLDGSGEPLERARAHIDLGAALRSAGRAAEAREPLRLAVDLAHRAGATALEAHALAELRAAGARPRRRVIAGPGALTPSERRIADLAASGRLNRDIAEALVVTVATVEYHLRNVYRKLGITSRKQLSETLGDRPANVQVRVVRAPAGGSYVAFPAGRADAGVRWRSSGARDTTFTLWDSRSPSATSTL
jgi:DNA-binding CsgD family transcriptional regulator